MDHNTLFVEETLDDGYKIIFTSQNVNELTAFMQNYSGNNRIELWSRAHAETCKGYGPLAFRDKNSNKLIVSHTFKMFYLDNFYDFS